MIGVVTVKYSVTYGYTLGSFLNFLVQALKIIFYS